MTGHEGQKLSSAELLEMAEQVQMLRYKLNNHHRWMYRAMVEGNPPNSAMLVGEMKAAASHLQSYLAEYAGANLDEAE